MRTLNHAVLKTLAYLDLFDFAPSLLELERWLLRTDEPHTATDIQHVLESDPHIHCAEGFYFLTDRDQLVALRKQKYRLSEEKWKRTRRYLRLVAVMPFVDGVWLINSMGWENARERSDVDLLIVARPGHIWSARLWTTAVMKLLRQRPHEQSEDRAICLSLYISADHLNLEPYRLQSGDIHYSFWVNQCYPLYDTGQYEKFQQHNAWLKKVFAQPRWPHTIERRMIRLTAAERAIKRLLELCSNEQLFKKIQWRILPNNLRAMANQDQRVVMNDTILKLHTNDRRQQKQQQWEERLRALQI